MYDDLRPSIDELIRLLDAGQPRFAAATREPHAPRYTPEDFCGGHVEALAFARDAAPFQHVMCARQAAKSTTCDGIMYGNAQDHPRSTNLLLGLKGTGVKISNWVPIWKQRVCERYQLSESCHNETAMLTTFPNESRVMFAGTDDLSNIKKYLGNSLPNSVVVIDECFPAGTLVDGRPIETIGVGDEVRAVDHDTGEVVRRPVVRVFRKSSVDLVRVHAGDRSFVCTGNHPVFVKGKGYVHARFLSPGDMLCVRSAVAESPHVLTGVPIHLEAQALGREHLAHTGGQRAHGSGDASQQPDATRVLEGEGTRDTEEDWSSAADQGRQRSRPDESGGGTPRSPGATMEDRRGGANPGTTSFGVWISDLLQVGSGGHIDQDLYRGRWSQPQPDLAQTTGREENGALVWARVDGVSRDERGGDGGVAVYNLEVEGAHTYFANGVLVHNCQDQQPHVLNYILNVLLPPMLTSTTRVVVSGVLPDMPVGMFLDLSRYDPESKTGGKGHGYSHHEWGRAANVHTPEAMAWLQKYLHDHNISIDDPRIQRDWFMRRVWDLSAGAYRYRSALNGYEAEMMPQALDAYVQHEAEGGGEHALMYAHPMREDSKDGARVGLMAAKPNPGVKFFSFALDPGAGDRASVQGWGWGDNSREVQHVFDWSTPRAAGMSTGQMFAIMGLAQRIYAGIGGQTGGVVSWRYDTTSKNTIDNLQHDYGIPVVLAAKKTDLKGQIDRCNDLLTQARAKVMVGSSLEQDYQRSMFDPDAKAKGLYRWSSGWHPDPAEAARYAMQDYFDAYKEPEPVPTDPLEIHRAEVREMLREARARDEADEMQ